MTCADVRHLILTADPTALRDRTDPVLRQHLDGCAECATASALVVADVSRLRAALIARGAARISPAARQRRSTKRVAMTLVPMALAAELALFAVLSSREAPNPLIDRTPITEDTVSMLPVVAQTTVDTGEVERSVPASTPILSERSREVPAQPDTGGRAAPMREAAPSVQVTPKGRQQYAVIGTSNPKITVVWYMKGDTL